MQFPNRTPLKKYDKKITIIRHALAHNSFSITENGYEFFSDWGNCKLNYREFNDFIHKIENEFYQK